MSKFYFAFMLALLAPATASARVPDSITTPAYTSATFVTRDGLSLRYLRYPQLSETLHPVVIAPGSGESAYRYESFVDLLRSRGYGPVYILEHRGQGHSEGTGTRPDLIYVEHFGEYVVDFADFMRGPIARDLKALGFQGPPDLIAHSMGGAIANLALYNDPGLARKVAYVAPMMDINTAILNPGHDRLALWAAKFLCATGLCDDLAISGTGSRRRLKIPGVSREVEEGIFRGAVTPGWLKESIRATRQIREQAAAHAEPSLVVMAKQDRLVENKSLRAYAGRAENCDLAEIDGPHGLHHDARSQGRLLDLIDGFFGGCESSLTN